MRLKVMSIPDVVQADLCCGCGACAAVSGGTIEMIDDLDHGRRPRTNGGPIPEDIRAETVRVCPGIALEHHADPAPGTVESVRDAFGPVLEVWEGYAADADVRFTASSGGAATALAAHGLERGGWHGVLHIAARPEAPHLNETVLSRSTDDLRGRTGSRYAPASPCDGLDRIEAAPGPCGFIGKPCDVAGAQRAAAGRPALADRLALTIGIFCAGTPTPRGTMQMLRRMGIDDPRALVSLRYRGHGWPGDAAAATCAGGTIETRRLSYEESWGQVLARHKQWRCRVCADHTAEFADVAVGDPWYRPIEPGEPGRSLIVARTERGRAFLHDAISAGGLIAWPVGPAVLEASQPELVRARGMAWGRRLGMRIRGRTVPRFRRLPMMRFWWSHVGAAAKVRSIVSGLCHRSEASIVPGRPVSAGVVARPAGFIGRAPEEDSRRAA